MLAITSTTANAATIVVAGKGATLIRSAVRRRVVAS
jgi:hypothetical protein